MLSKSFYIKPFQHLVLAGFNLYIFAAAASLSQQWVLRLVHIRLLILSLLANIYFRKIFPPKLGPAELD